MGASEDERSAADAAREKKSGDAACDGRSYDEAVQHYTRGAGLDPLGGAVDPLIRRAAAYYHMAKYEECIRDCDAAVRKGRELGAGKRLLALALARKGAALLELAAAGCSGHYKRAIRALHKSLVEHSSSRTRAMLYRARAKMYMARAREEETEAEAEADDEQERPGPKAAAYHHRKKGLDLDLWGAFDLDQGGKGNRRSPHRKGGNSDASSSDEEGSDASDLECADYLYKDGRISDLEEGSDAFDRKGAGTGYCRKEGSDDFDMKGVGGYYHKKGNQLLKQEKYQEAAAHYTKAMEKNPNDPRVFNKRAQCHIYLGALSEALQDAVKCIELDPTFLKGYVHKAKAEFLKLNFDNARTIYLEALKCDPNNVELLDGIRRCEAFHKWANDDIVELVPAELKDILGEPHSTNRQLQKILEEAAAFKKKAAQKQKKTEESLSRVQLKLEQIKIQKDEATQELQKANEHIKHLEDQLWESRELHNMLLSEHDRLLLARDGAVREAEKLRQNRGQMLSVLVTAMHCEFSSPELQRATENFSSSLKIGEGGFGSVYKGVLRNMTVAIKVLKPGNLQGQPQFEQEVAILSKVRHPHLVTLMGACSEKSTLVYEFLPNGSLEDFLECAEKRRALSWQIRVRIAAEICSALIFLHKNKPHPVVHSDLKPANVLLDANFVSKLGDFGISRFLMDSSTNGTALYLTMQPAGTRPYMDPEFLATGELTAQSDGYSFGILVLRLLTGRPPAGIRQLVEDAMEEGELSSLVDASAGEWPYTCPSAG